MLGDALIVDKPLDDDPSNNTGTASRAGRSPTIVSPSPPCLAYGIKIAPRHLSDRSYLVTQRL